MLERAGVQSLYLFVWPNTEQVTQFQQAPLPRYVNTALDAAMDFDRENLNHTRHARDSG